ncbi:putative bacterial RNA polymerase inhibitor [Dickeya phage vB_DsoP_JA10]|uniref:Putative bacterial RNA polymerase inhibitor n=1 Tax=Dickeya phage vB_DsoP_JA10 TaxID=2283033 RepID=A0A384ZVU9_9CAUD|nr:RNA polymerase inhibitor [Dickeya phage vB_DsoP_JA10]AXG66369.1 putative bacterial RNA polymerase inhibitor [Dickeya phage vB_DsoP_JA10]
MSEKVGGLVPQSKKFFVTIENAKESFEVPVFAIDIEDAQAQAALYEDAGFEVVRIRPEVKRA